MNTRTHRTMKLRGSADTSYLGRTVDEMIWDFMQEQKIPGLTLAIVQAPYIPRVVGYGMSDTGQKRLASVNTMWPVGPLSQAFAAVAVMQLYEEGSLKLEDTVGVFLPDIPQSWKEITVLQLLRHASGLPDYRRESGFCAFREWSFQELTGLIKDQPLHFESGSDVEQSATNFLILTEIIERASGMSYHDFITQRQIKFLGLRHIGFAEDLDAFSHEDVSQTENIHLLFKRDETYIDPTETAASYDESKNPVPRVCSSALRGFSDIWASAQDISTWDIGLAGSVLIREPQHRALLYAPWELPDGREVPAVAGWQFYGHRGLMDIKGSVPGFSSFLSRFTDASELVCVTLLANKEGVNFTNLGRQIAGAFGDLLSTNYDDGKLFLLESQFSAAVTERRLKEELERREIPLFAEFDHADNAKKAGLKLRPTTVFVFGSPKVGTGLMQEDQSISLELPLRISVWEDEGGSIWLAFPRVTKMAAEYGLETHSAVSKIEGLMEELVQKAGNIY